MIYGLLLVEVATMAPSPVPSATASAASCPNPNHAAVLVNPVLPNPSPTLEREAFENGAQSVAIVQVLLGPDGKVQETKIYRSTGSEVLDTAAIAAAKKTTYTPKVVNCQPVAGEYLLSLPFPH